MQQPVPTTNTTTNLSTAGTINFNGRDCFFLAECHRADGNDQDAINFYSGAATCGYEIFKSYNFIAEIFRKNKQFYDAIDYYKKAIINNNNNEENKLVWCTIGDISYFDKKNYEESIEYYTQAFNLDNTYGYAMSMIGDAYRSLGAYSTAYEWYSKITENDPTYSHLPIIWFLQAQMLHLSVSAREIDYYQKALDVIVNDPNFTDQSKATIFRACGDAHWKLNKYEDALEAYNQAMSLNPNSLVPWQKRALEQQKLEGEVKELTLKLETLQLEKDQLKTEFTSQLEALQQKNNKLKSTLTSKIKNLKKKNKSLETTIKLKSEMLQRKDNRLNKEHTLKNNLQQENERLKKEVTQLQQSQLQWLNSSQKSKKQLLQSINQLFFSNQAQVVPENTPISVSEGGLQQSATPGQDSPTSNVFLPTPPI